MNRTVASIGLFMLMGMVGRTLGQDPIFTYRADGNSFTSNVYLNSLPARAFRHFRKTYPSVAEERWMKDDASVKVVDFSGEDIRTVYEYRLDGKRTALR